MHFESGGDVYRPNSCRHVYYERSISTHRRSDSENDICTGLRPAESVVSDRTDALPVKVSKISTGMLNQGPLEAGPDVVAGTVVLVNNVRFHSHMVKVAGCSTDVNYPIRSASGHGGAHRCAITTRNPEFTGSISSVQNSSCNSGGTQNKCMCEKRSHGANML